MVLYVLIELYLTHINTHIKVYDLIAFISVQCIFILA
jgi:hypothetical protein